jgi:PAS domain S-box-containing protein
MNRATRILVVDDEPAVLDFFTLILRQAGYEVWGAADGKHGLQMTRERRPDLVLLDVGLPDLNGFDVCRQIKADADLLDTFVVLISGKAISAADKVDGAEIGADDYMVKPVNTDEFLARIRTVVRLRDTTAALRASEQHYRRLVEILPDAVGTMDLQGRLTAVNRQAVEMLGYAGPEELLGKSVFDLTPPEEHERVKTNLATTIETGVLRNAEDTMLRKNGSQVLVELCATVSMAPDSQSRGIVMVVRDITARRQAEESLRQSREQYRTLAESSPDAIFILDRESAIQYVNSAARQWLGQTDAGLLGRSLAGFFPPEIAQQHQAGVQQAFKTGQPIRAERGLPFHGTVKWIETRLVPLPNPRGEILSLMVIARDLTEQKRVEEALDEREELSQKIIGTALEGFWMLDVGGNLLDVNEAYCRMSGFSREELLTMHISDLEVNESSRELVARHVQRIIQSGSDRFETRHRSKDGRIIEVEVVATFLKLREHYVFAFMRDITERKRAEAYLRLQSTALESAANAIVITDSAGKAIWLNPAFTRLTGYSAQEVVGHNMRLLKSGQHDHAFYQQLWETILAGRIWRAEMVNRRKDGSLYTEENIITPVQGEHGEITHFVAIKQNITRRKEAEQLLQMSQERFQQLAENIKEVFWITSPAKNEMIYISPGYETIWGRTCASLYASPMSWVEAIHPEDRERVMEAVLTKQVSGQYDEVYRIRRPEGSLRWIHDRAFPVKDEAGNIFRVVGIAEDITGRKLAESRLATLVHAVESTAEMICITDMEDRFTFVNRAFLQAYGYTKEEVLGQKPAMLAAPTNPPTQMSDILEQTRLNGWRGEVLDRRKDGTEFPVFLSTSKIMDPDGHIIGLMGVAQDISERKRTEEQIRLLAYAVQSARDLIWITDGDNRFTFVNQSFVDTYGYSPEEILGRKRDLLVSSKHAPTLYEHIHRETRDGSWGGELLNCKKDGTEFPISLSTSEIKNHEGRIIGVVGVVRDITERKQAEEVLRRLPLRIIEAQEAERLRVARELHDGVNQLLASAKMRLHKVEDGVVPLNPAAREILARCSRLLVQALEENRRIAHNLRPSDLDEFGLAAASRNFCKEFQSRTKLEVKYSIARIDQRLAPALELNLFRIMQEAFNNIERHAHASKVRLRIAFHGDSIVLKIQDDGRGFDPQRGKAGKGKWRGIGLTNMRERAEFLGGTCSVESAPKQGAIITVRVPCGKDQKM